MPARVAQAATHATWYPLCRRCHQEQHRVGIETFQERHGVDLACVAESLEEAYQCISPDHGS